MGIYNAFGQIGDWGYTIYSPVAEFGAGTGAAPVYDYTGSPGQGMGLGPIGGEYGPLVNPTAAPTGGAPVRYSTGTGFSTRSPDTYNTAQKDYWAAQAGVTVNSPAAPWNQPGATAAPAAAPAAPTQGPPMTWGTTFSPISTPGVSPYVTAGQINATPPALSPSPAASPNVEQHNVTATPSPQPVQSPNYNFPTVTPNQLAGLTPTLSPGASPTATPTPAAGGQPKGGGGSSGGGSAGGGGPQPQQPQQRQPQQRPPVINIRNVIGQPGRQAAGGARRTPAGGLVMGYSPAAYSPAQGGYSGPGGQAGGAGGFANSAGGILGGTNSNLWLALLFGGGLLYAASKHK